MRINYKFLWLLIPFQGPTASLTQQKKMVGLITNINGRISNREWKNMIPWISITVLKRKAAGGYIPTANEHQVNPHLFVIRVDSNTFGPRPNKILVHSILMLSI